MSAVYNLVSYFENLNAEMDFKKSNLNRKASSKSVPEKNSKMKQFFNDLTEIRRPSGKHKSAQENTTSEKAKTLPRRYKEKGNSKTKSDNKVSELQYTHQRDKKNELKTQEVGLIINDTVQKVDETFEHSVKIEEKVAEFGKNLKQKRQQQEKISDAELTTDDCYFDAPEYENHSIASNAEEVNNIYVEDEEANSDDMFGSNDFDETKSDNYIVESYNKVGLELVITTLQITQHTRTQNKVENEIKELIENSDYIVHRKEYDDIAQSSSDSDTVYENMENLNLHCSSSNSINLQNYPRDSYVSSDSETLYEEIYETRNSNVRESEEEKDNFYQNLGDILYNDLTVETRNEEFESTSSDTSNTNSANLPEKKDKINYIIEEMIRTEEQYISGLKKVVDGYMPYLFQHAPPNLIGKTAYIFGNISKIYQHAQQFLTLLKEADGNPDVIAQIFVYSAQQFELYPLYSKNKPTADIYLKQFSTTVVSRQEKLGDKLGLASYLLTPIQRMGKYKLLLEQIQKELKKQDKSTESVTAALNIIRKVMRKGNDYIAIDSIKDSPITLTLEGSFIIRATFNIHKPKKFESMVFLFEKIVVFTEKCPKNAEQFKYVDSIKMSDLSLGKFEEKPNIFHLTNYSKLKRGNLDATYILEAESKKIKNEWTDIIEKELWIQLEKAKEQQKKVSLVDHRHQPKTTALRSSLRKPSRKSLKTKAKTKFYDQHAT